MATTSTTGGSTTPTSGGTATSFSNTPQAKDDFFSATQTGLTEDSNNTVKLYVMANDSGGAAKTLYSLDDGLENDGTAGADLLIKDAVAASQTSANGATISINSDGSVNYSMSPELRDKIQYLGAGELFTDTFTYAIRLGNGTLSWATATVQIAGTNDAATFTGDDTKELTETDASQTTGGTLVAHDVDSAQTFQAQTNVAGSKGYGKFTIGTDGVWTYTMDSGHNEFVAGQTYTDTLTVKSADGTEHTLTVNILGTNDAAVIGGATTKAVTEGDAAATISTSGQLTISDVDSAATFVAQTDVAGSNGYGKFTIGTNGAWTYTADSAHNEFVAGQTYTDSVTVAAADGTSQVVTVTITGTNDAPVAHADTAAGTENQTLTINVLANDTDVDDQAVLSLVSASAPKGVVSVENGKLVFNPGTDFDHLKAGASEKVTLTYVMKDDQGAEATSTVEVTVTGTNDTPTVAAALTASANEGDASFTKNLLQGASDLDDGETATLAVANVTYKVDVGTASATAPAGVSLSGSMLTVDPTNAAFDHLAQGVTQTIVVSYDVTDVHGAKVSQTETITITGTNDAPVITSSAQAGSVTEIADGASDENTGTLSDQGTITFADVDTLDTHTASFVPQASSGYLGTFALVDADTAVDGIQTSGHSVGWSFSVADAAIDFLAAGETRTQKYDVNVNDGHGGTVTQTVTVTITGTNDAPVITTAAGQNEGAVVEAGDLDNGTDVAGAPSASGMLTSSDVDHNATAAWSLDRTAGAYGSIAIDPATGKWTYTLDNSTGNPADKLAEGETKTETFTATVTDDKGATATQVVTVTITGTNDAPVITSGPQVGTVKEDGTLTASGQVQASDVDHGAVLAYSISGSADGAYGSLSVDPETGEWTYTLANAAHQDLAAGETHNEAFTVLVTDDKGATTSQTVTVTVQGTNDVTQLTSVAADVAGSTSVNEATNAHAQDLAAITGKLTFSDKDVGDTLAALVVSSSVVASTGVRMPAGLEAALKPALAFGDAVTSNGGPQTIAWTYDPSAVDLDFLREGQTLTVTYNVKVGDSAAQPITITITGTNDGATISGTFAGAVKEDTDVGSDGKTLTATGSVSVSDADAGENHVQALEKDGAYGHFSMGTDGTWTYTAENSQAAIQQLGAGQFLTETFTIKSADGTDSNIVTVTITGANDAAVIGSPTVAAVTEDVAVTDDNLTATGSISISDADQNQGAFQTAVTPTAGTLGTLTLAANGAYTYAVANSATQYLGAGETKVDTFTVTALDGTTKQVSFTIMGTSDAPTIVSATDAGTVTEDDATPTLSDTGTVTFDDLDLTDTHIVVVTPAAGNTLGGQLTAVVSDPATGAGDGTVTWTYNVANSATHFLAAGQTASESFTIQVSDNHGGFIDQTVTVTITGTNDEVQITSLAQSGTVAEDAASTADATDTATATGTIAFSDVDLSDSHTAAFVAAVSNTTALGSFLLGTVSEPANAATGSVGWTYAIDNTAAQYLAAGQSATETYTVTVSDGHGGTATQDVTVTITGTNDAPVVAAALTAAAAEGAASFTKDLLAGASDVDHGETATLAITQVSYSVDGGASSTTAPAGVSLSGSTLTVDPTNAAFDHLAVGEHQTIMVSYKVTDAQGAAVDQSETITITGTNDGPVAVADTATGTENQTLTIDVLANDTDVDDGHALTLVSGSAPKGVVSVENGKLVFNPGSDFDHLAKDATETVTLTYTMRDEHGAQSTSSVTVTITGTNDAPTGTASATLAGGTEDTAYTVSAADLLAGFSDVDGDTLSVSGLTANHGTLVDNHDGTWTFTPAANYNGPVSLSYTVVDGNGGTVAASQSFSLAAVNDAPVATNGTGATDEDTAVQIDVASLISDIETADANLTVTASVPAQQGTVLVNGTVITFTPAANFNGPATISYSVSDGQLTSATASIAVNVAPVNDAPVAQAGTAAGNEDTPITGSVTATDVDSASLTYSVVSGPAADKGTLEFNPDGSYTFTPIKDFFGEVTFTYKANDGSADSNVETVKITVNPVNDAPVAVDDTGTVAEEGTVTIDVLANDTDVDGPSKTIASVKVDPAQGTAEIVDGKVVFTAAKDFNGDATITYTVSDGTLSDEGQAVVKVMPVNDAPVAVGDLSATVAEGATYTLTVADLGEADPDDLGTGLTYTVSSVTNGGVLLNGSVATTFTAQDVIDGKVSFHHDGSETTSASFGFSLADGGEDGASPATGTFNFTVTPVNDGLTMTFDQTLTSTTMYKEKGLVVQTMAPGDVLSGAINDWDASGSDKELKLYENPDNGQFRADSSPLKFSAENGATFTFDAVDVISGASAGIWRAYKDVDGNGTIDLAGEQTFAGSGSQLEFSNAFENVSYVTWTAASNGDGQVIDNLYFIL